MSRATAITGACLVLAGLLVFAWKAVFLALPVLPSHPKGLWQVELEVTVRGSGMRGSVRLPLPSSGPGQVVFDEHTASDRLLFTIREARGERTGIWHGKIRDVHALVHGFRVELAEVRTPLPSGPVAFPPEEIVQRWQGPTLDAPSLAPAVQDLLEDLRVPPPDDAVGRLRVLFSFVSEEIATVPTGSGDALLTLAAREGSQKGVTRLFVTLLRAADIPARPVLGLRLTAGGDIETVSWAEAWIDGTWIPVSPSDGFFARRPANRLAIQAGSLEFLDTVGTVAVGYRYRAARERLRPSEIAAMMVPTQPALSRISLYRLPVTTQDALRSLLLLPLGGLVVALFRNLVGIPTFGTFMPVLIGFALRGASLALGLSLVGAVLTLGILARLVLERLRLLLVPRLAILLCIVTLAVTALALLGRGLGERELSSGVLFPMVILTMLVERFSVTMDEEGLRPALVRAGYSVLVAVAVLPIFWSRTAEHLMFGFPELVVSVMGLLVWIGGYTGYRLSDLIRFRAVSGPDDTGRM